MTPKQPFDIDSKFVSYAAYGPPASPMLLRNGGVDLAGGTDGTFSGGISLLHLTLGSNPPVLTPQSTQAMRLGPESLGVVAIATDGTAFYTIDEYQVHHVTGRISAWSALNELERSSDLVDLGGPALLEVTNGLLFALYGYVSTPSPNSEMLIADASSGAVLWARLVEGATTSGTSYACGFAYALTHGYDYAAYAGTTVTMLPLDGQPESTATVDADSAPGLYPWPYDPRTVAVLWRRPNFMPETDGGCAVHLALVRDDGTVSSTQTFPHACNFPIASESDTMPELAVGSFGALLHDGAGNFQLLDASGAPIGDQHRARFVSERRHRRRRRR